MMKSYKILIIGLFLFISKFSNAQCTEQLTKVTLYTPYYYYKCFSSETKEDIINRSDSFSTKVVTDSNQLLKIDSALVNNKFYKEMFCDSIIIKPLKKYYSFDIMHIFMLEYSDSSTVYICFPRFKNMMMVNDKLYKIDTELIHDLYFYTRNEE